ncbi:MAG TPA: S1 RNA-binding domain-containing protein [Bacillota bacterium]|nr:S1 RNA-binding domain-containing protein [Bacillota bacterium]
MQAEIGSVIKGKVTKVAAFGAFVAFGDKSGMIHISQLSSKFVRDINEFVTVGDEIEAVIIGIDAQGRISLSKKQLDKARKAPPAMQAHRAESETDFESMMSRFKSESDEKMHALKKALESKQGTSGKKRR